MSEENADDKLTTGEAAKLIDCSLNHVQKLYDTGVLKGGKLGRDRRIYRWSVEQYISDNENTKAGDHERYL